MVRARTAGTVARAQQAGRGGRRSRALGGALAILALLSSLLFASQALATTYTWSGGSSTAPAWSAGANWEGGLSPSSPASLEFPRLSRVACTYATPTEACYASQNDLTGLTVEAIQIDDGDLYEIWGNPIQLGGGGLTASPASGSSGPAGDFLEMPIELSAGQTWKVNNRSGGAIGENGMFLSSALTGAHPLTISLSEAPALYVAGSAEVGPLTIEGANSSKAGALNGLFALLGGELDSVDGSSVSLSHIFFIGSGSTGPLTGAGTEVAVGYPEYPAEGVKAASATLDAASEALFFVSGPGSTAGADYSHLTSSGALDLGGAGLSLVVTPPAEGKPCPTLSPGRQYTLVSTTATLSGSFGNAPEGSEIPIRFAKSCLQVSQLLKIAYDRTGSPQTVVGTVIAGPSSTTSLSASPSASATNQTVTLTATITASFGAPSGTVEFRVGGTPLAGCASQPVASVNASYTATCRTSFAASSSPESLSAAFIPAAGVNLKPSVSGPYQLNVGKDPTTTALAASTSTPQAGSSVTYTATVSAQDPGPLRPSGSVEFLDGATPIGSCASQPLSATGSATCQTSYASAGAHSITARYAADADFAASSSQAQQIAVQQPVAPPLMPAPPPMPSKAWLVNSAAAVQSNGWTALKIGCEGIEACRGKLLLQITQRPATQRQRKRRHKKSSRTVTIGEASFSIAGSTTASVAVQLDGLARRLLKAGHGRLNVRLLIAQSKPGETTRATVRLAARASRRRGKRKK